MSKPIEMIWYKLPKPEEGPKYEKFFYKKGTILNPEDPYCLPLACDIIKEKDISMQLRDGTTIYTDVIYPADMSGPLPAIVCWSPYGKSFHRPDCPWYAPERQLSGLQKYEAPDPGFFCPRGYVMVHPDARGAWNSEGVTQIMTSQEACDGYDFIEWVAAQPWCDGNVGMGGNSWLSIAQYKIANEVPPHLRCIAPWEGMRSNYSDLLCRGGIPEWNFAAMMVRDMHGSDKVEALDEMIKAYPLMNEHWEDKICHADNIKIPTYMISSYTNVIHPHGTFRIYLEMDKVNHDNLWLRVHNQHEWTETVDQQPDLCRFYDRYLKGEDNGWENTPRVRLSVLDAGGECDIVNRPENEWPLARTEYRKLYLDAGTGSLVYDLPSRESSVSYVSDDRKDMAVFDMRFPEETELTGYMKAHLWMESPTEDDMDVFVTAEKLNEKGELVWSLVYSAPFSGHKGGPFYGAHGQLRASLRALDEEATTDFEPHHSYRKYDKLKPGQPVLLDIALWPWGQIFHKGETLRLCVCGFSIQPPEFPDHPPIPTLNKGIHIVHTGGKYDSYLQVPYIPAK